MQDPPRSTVARFAPWTTPVYAVMWLAIVVQGWGPLVDRDPVFWLQDPAGTAERLTERDLELAEAIARDTSLGRPVLDRLYGAPEEARSWAIDVQRELLARDEILGLVDREAVRQRLAVLLLDWGGDEAAEELRALQAGDPGLPLLDPESWEAAGLSSGYRLRGDRAVAAARGDESAWREADAALAIRAETWKLRSLGLVFANWGLVLIGCVIVGVRAGHAPELLASNATPPWPLADGVGVFVRGDFWNRSFFLYLAWLGGQPAGMELAAHPVGALVFTWGSLFASLPLLWLAHRHLLAPAGLGFAAGFGFTARPAELLRLGAVALGAIAIDLAGTHAISWSAWGAGVGASWAEGFDEILVWGSPVEAALTSIDYGIWAPALEELAFRGVLYFSLRHRLAPLPAALATAGFFAGLHFYSLPGFAMTLWSGFVWALAFERARSLLPGIAAHAVYNALFVAGLLLLYR